MEVSCSKLWSTGLPDPSLVGAVDRCEEFYSAQIGENKYKAFFIKDIWTNNPKVNELAEAVKEGIEKSVNLYNSLGNTNSMKMPSVYVLYADFPAKPLNPGGHVQNAITYPFFKNNEACPIIIYSGALTLDSPKQKQMVAHELFHCYQFKNILFGNKRDVFIKNQSARESNGWWLEGSANYFSNLVYPSVNSEYLFDPLYDANVEVPFQTLSYSTTAFFQYMGDNTYGGPGRMAFIFKVIKFTDNKEDQLKGARSLSEGMNFHLFAEKFIMKAIPDSGGGFHPTVYHGPTTQYFIDKETTSYEVEFKPFTIASKTLKFAPGGIYNFTVTNDNPLGNNYFSYRDKNATSWQYFNPYTPANVDTSCDKKERVLEFLPTSMAIKESVGELEKATLNFEYKEASCPCKDATAPNSCIIGTWKMDNKSFDNYMKNFFKPYNGDINYLGSMGDLYITISSDQRLKLSSSDFQIIYAMKNPSVGVTSLFVGGLLAEVGATNDGYLCLKNIDGPISVHNTINMGGTITTGEGDLPIDSKNTFVKFSCNQNTLIIINEAIGSRIHFNK
ncbi:MAG: hypothetical protein HQK51_01965 [Oligoflexia bacterium]|nr:hypothetical protein [Oligoflexia bacterium]